ncbi:protein FAM169B-like isoform X2 [Hyperolius riggenbachi]|uniref:protein FAM169B-like isoform X2 n=1 Tax=Hyperolius riggenbachi TaxID=752182 RepID=UPI0035A347CA
MMELASVSSHRGARAGELCFPVDWQRSSDLQSLLESSAQHYLRITQQHGYSEFFCCPDGEKVNVDGNSVLHMPLYRDEESQKMLLLVHPQRRDEVLAVYLKDRWWCVVDLLHSYFPIQEGLRQVQTCGERIVLFVLNCLVCGFAEGGGPGNRVCFLPHSAGELAKILWHRGEAVAFYTYKIKGSLYDGSSQCYMLPVLDTIYVRQEWRKHGFGTAMLQDYCQTFTRESALGISFPLSADMYHVCHRFLADNPKEQDRLWEVDAPGDWSQRVNIWLQIQLGETPVMALPAEEMLEPTGKDLLGIHVMSIADEAVFYNKMKRAQTGKKLKKRGVKKRKKKLTKETGHSKMY